jgi:broad specificity phosphatase PhoE
VPAMHSTRLVLVRHGHVATHGVLCGWTDLPLSELGHRQAEVLASTLRVDLVYASPLRRARDTARHLELDAHYELGLREIGCGNLDGKPLAEIQRDAPRLWAANEAQGDDDFRWPAGESYRELRRRSIAALVAITARHPGQRVGIVTHAGVITQVLGYLNGTPAARWSAFRVGNASTTEIDWLVERGTVRSYDVRDHLEPQLRS